MRRFPARVRAAILKGVVSFDLSPARDTERAIDILLDDCAADNACRAAYPNIKREYEEVVSRLAKGPVKVEFLDRESDKPGQVEMPLVVFLSTLRSLLQNTGSANQVLSMIHQASKNDFAPLAQSVVTLRRAFGSVISIGMALSVFCSEDGVVSAMGAAIGPDTLDPACRMWPRGALPRDHTAAVRAKIPALILSGFLDPATPPSWAENVARQLPESRHIVIRNASHSYTGLSPCVDNIMSEFISAGSAKGLDVSCVDRIRRPPFELIKSEAGSAGK
jgi:pimeloyl-ACP methyl ester carboxylesterase